MSARVQIVIGLVLAAIGALTMVVLLAVASTSSVRDFVGDRYTLATSDDGGRSRQYTSPDPPSRVVADITGRWRPAERLNDPAGHFLRYRDDYVVVTPDGTGGSRIHVDDEEEGYPALVRPRRGVLGHLLQPVRGRPRPWPGSRQVSLAARARAYAGAAAVVRAVGLDAVPAGALPVLRPQDAEELVVELAEATEAQGICYGWRVTVDDREGTAGGVDVGSSRGAGTPAQAEDCPRWMVFEADLIYTESSSESEDSATFGVVSNGRPRRPTSAASASPAPRSSATPTTWR